MSTETMHGGLWPQYFFIFIIKLKCARMCHTGGHLGGQQHLRGLDVAAPGSVCPGQGGAEPGGLREEWPALLPLASPDREGRGASGLVRQRPHRPAAAQLQQSTRQKQR